MKGVAYSPVGAGADVTSADDARQHLLDSPYRADFAAMREANINTVKTYVDMGLGPGARRFMDAARAQGLWVLVTLSPDATHAPGEPSNDALIDEYRSHPALLGFVCGNEWNLNLFYSYPSGIAAAQAAEQLAQLVRARDPDHPVFSSLGFFPLHYNLGPNIAASEIPTLMAAVPAVDVWGFNIYRAAILDPWFLEWETLAPGQPFFLSEFGTDSWASSNTTTGAGAADEPTAANVLHLLWDGLHRQLSASDPSRSCIGGVVFAWNDEWWKAGSPSSHDHGGFPLLRTFPDYQGGGDAATFLGHPDGFSSEEHYGLVRADRTPKAAIQAATQAFGLGTTSTAAIPLAIRTQGGGADSHFVMSKRGLPFALRYASFSSPQGGRGFNVAVMDRATGAVKALKNFDTYLFPDSASLALQSFLAGLTSSDVVFLAVADTAFPNPGFCTPMSAVPAMAPCTAALQQLGSQMASDIKFWQPWAMIAVPGNPGMPFAESLGSGDCSSAIYGDASIATLIVLDFDGDGLTDDIDGDLDNDGVDNDLELINGTDVLDPGSF